MSVAFNKEQRPAANEMHSVAQQVKLQPKLTVGAVNDPLEYEADAMADKVMRKPESPVLATGGTSIQRKCKQCEEEDARLQRKPIASFIQRKSSSAGITASEGLSNQINASRGSGTKMDNRTETFMQSRFGTDFSNVKIHTGGEAIQMNRELNAKAFTVGNDIYFNEGQYNPGSNEGKHLLAHELTHTVQQQNFLIQKDEDKTASDPETEFGKSIITNSPDGLKIGIYDHYEAEMIRKSGEWALAENGIGFNGVNRAVKFSDLAFGKAISDENDAGKTINEISTIAKTAVDKANKLYGTNVGEQYKIKTLAFFAHGTEGWCSISPISGSAGKELIKRVAPSLNNDVNIIIYACSVANSPLAKHDDWDKGTMDPGGKDSMAAGVRDELFDQNLTAGKVWGHTTVGHVTTNFALRYFESNAKGTEGSSYVSENVFTPFEEFKIRQEVIKQLTAEGFNITTLDETKLISYQFKNLRQHFYACYAQANSKLKYNERNLAEAAPNHPAEVAKVINDYWNATYWPKIKTNYIKAIVKQFKLVKATK